MTRYLILGIVQGLTEFLPVSSSGHLVLAEHVLHLDPPGVLLEAILHLGTLCSILIVFRRDILRLALSLFQRGENGNEVVKVLIATLPVIVVGFFLQSRIEDVFSSILLIGICLCINGGILFYADRANRRADRVSISLSTATLIGFAQAASLLPGISRSGATISTGLFLGIRGQEAVRFSFLLAIPAIFGAGLFQLYQVHRTAAFCQVNGGGFLLGGLAAAIVGTLAIKGLLAVVYRGRLKVFAGYCLAIGISAVIYALCG
jgi:undecaprenyl-diphosphatase